MSAFTVVLNRDGAPVDPTILKAMTLPASQLGPDGINYLYQGNIGLAYLAFNTTPESLLETQPLRSEEGRYLLVADARIDNRPELLPILRTYLPNKAIQTDPDIILAAYRRWGVEAPTHLIGDFAFVIWDATNQELFAARDIMQIRPLHYAKFANCLCITSEAHQITRHPKASCHPNKLALTYWLLAKPKNHLSMFEGINALPAGHSLTSNRKLLHTSKYWELNPEFHISYNKTADYEEHLRELLSRAINDRMRTNGSTIACELSGGMDSSTITALTHQQASKHNLHLLALSKDYKNNPSCREVSFIEKTVKHLGLDHQYIDIEKEGSLNYHPHSSAALESPSSFWLPHALPSTTHAANAGARILLTGHGGDELTAGYRLIYFDRLIHGDFRVIREIGMLSKNLNMPMRKILYQLIINPLIPEKIKEIKRSLVTSIQPNQSPFTPSWLTNKALEQLTIPGTSNVAHTQLFKNKAKQAWIQHISRSYNHACQVYRWAGGLSQVDVRHPFFDRRLLEFTFATPVSLWHQQGYRKWLLRQSMQGLLPDSVIWRNQKTRFDSYYKSELGSHQKTIAALLENNFLTSTDLINSDRFLDALDAYLKHEEDGSIIALFYTIATLAWCRAYSSSNQTE